MIHDFAKRFWEQRADETSASIRWTDADMLAFDVALVGDAIVDGGTLLDVGAGTGDIFLPHLDRLAHVTAVDMVAGFLERLPDDPRIETVVSDLAGFEPDRAYDTALMFGVVTHLDRDAELAAYRMLRRAAPEGTVIVKNQCGRDGDVDVDRFSEALGGQYMGRYPGVDAQRDTLATVFAEVDVVPYPAEFNRWPETMHAAFVCR